MEFFVLGVVLSFQAYCKKSSSVEQSPPRATTASAYFFAGFKVIAASAKTTECAWAECVRQKFEHTRIQVRMLMDVPTTVPTRAFVVRDAAWPRINEADLRVYVAGWGIRWMMIGGGRLMLL